MDGDMVAWLQAEALTDVMVAGEAHMVEVVEAKDLPVEGVDATLGLRMAEVADATLMVADATLVVADVVVAVTSAAVDAAEAVTLAVVAEAVVDVAADEGLPGRGTRSHATGRAVSRLRRKRWLACPLALRPTRKPKEWSQLSQRALWQLPRQSGPTALVALLLDEL